MIRAMQQPALNIGALLITVFASILEVFLLCLAGYILAWKGILDKKTQKQMNRINVSLFTPCLLFSKVAFFLSPEKLRELWVIPIFFIIVTAVSMCVAWCLGVTFRLRAFAIAASMFMNSNSLPVALMQSLVVTVHGLKWTPDDNKNAMIGRALTYLVLYSTFGMILRWSYGVKLLAQADDPSDSPIRLPDDGDEEGERRIRDLEAVLPSTSTSTMVDYAANDYRPKTPNIVIDDTSTRESSASPPPTHPYDKDATLRARPHHHTRKSSYFYRSFPNSPNQSRVSLNTEVEGDQQSEIDDGDSILMLQLSLLHIASPESPSVVQTYLLRPLVTFWHGFTDFMTVPLYAAFLSIIVAVAPPLQHTLETHIAGACSIPVTLVEKDTSSEGQDVIPTRMESVQEAGLISNGDDVDSRCKLPASKSLSSPSALNHCRDLFAKLNPTKRRPSVQPDSQKEGDVPLPGETRTVLIAVLSRMVLTPLVLMPLMAFAARDDWHSVFEDPVFVVSNVLLIASPPALTLAQITQAASGDAFERLISRTIFWSYCIVTPPFMIIYVVVGLILVGL
ncbi:hypothetical protein BT96DRAFT_955571 [Gymnopus androsaceus JB14]|uniref:Auxin efflux carrier n=1 Tax=Gymnopus androsaceus JB14 TaxID=1447944 RepID=A0A6A4I2K6_9AGAR|nr:hypothetical protein BT96DRAFT_955571 [Gymnopus androsaceus JB14]